MYVHKAYSGIERQGSTKGTAHVAVQLRKIIIFIHIFLYCNFLAA